MACQPGIPLLGEPEFTGECKAKMPARLRDRQDFCESAERRKTVEDVLKDASSKSAVGRAGPLEKYTLARPEKLGSLTANLIH